MPKNVMNIRKTNIMVLVYVGEVKCTNMSCGEINEVIENDKSPICINCKKCNKEIGVEWVDD